MKIIPDIKFNKKLADIAEKDFIRDPSDKNRNRLIEQNYKLINMVLVKYSNFLDSSKYDDMFQEGVFGLIEAAKRFDPDKNIKFNTYAVWWVRAKVQNYLMRERAEKYNCTKNLTFNKNSGKTGKDYKKKQESLKYSLSLNKRDTWQDGSEKYTLQETIPSDFDLHGLIEDKQLLGILISVAEPLLNTEVKRVIFYKRILNASPLVLQEIGNQYGVSKEAIRLQEKALLEKLKKNLKIKLKPELAQKGENETLTT